MTRFYKQYTHLFFIFLTISAFGQKGYNRDNPCNPGDTLIDRTFQLKFITDVCQKSIIALDFHNNIVWQTNPWTIDAFRSYDSTINNSFHTNHIRAFFLDFKKAKSDQYIYLRFFNSAIAAVIERKNGKLHLLGVM